MKKWIKAYLCFSQKERIGLLGLLILLGGFFAAPYFFSEAHKPLSSEELEWTNEVNYPQKLNERDSLATAESRKEWGGNRRFIFDPNTASDETLRQLGFTEKNIKTLNHYLEKGGRLKSPADLQKIWGMRKELVESLMPYVHIVSTADDMGNQRQNIHKLAYQSYPKRIPQKIEINTADQAAWEQLPGIGPVLAGRILKYRNHLGQFSSVEEIRKTYGLTDSVFSIIEPFLQLNPGPSSLLSQNHSTNDLPSVNSASEANLIKAGVSPEIATAIVLYRKQYGLFQKLEDLRKIVFIQSAQYERLIQQVRL